MKKESNKKHNRTWIYLGLLLFFFSGFLNISRAEAATALNEPLDKENPVYFYGDTITYQDKTTTLDASNIYIDGSLSDEICSKYPVTALPDKRFQNNGKKLSFYQPAEFLPVCRRKPHSF